MSRPSEQWAAVWELLAKERAQLVAVLRGSGLSHEDGEDVLHSFVLDVMPRVVQRAEHLTEDERARYLRAALRNFVRSVLRTHSREENALLRLAVEPQAREHPEERLLDAGCIEHAISQLPEESARAVGAFLGIGRAPRSIREIARELGLTRYSTKKLLQDGLLAAALGLRQTGVLSSVEVEACRRVILDGQDLESIAGALGLTVEKVRRALASARAVVARSLS